MPTLQEKLLAPDIQPQVVADGQDLVEHEVATMAGVTGTAVRLAYKTVRTFDAGHIRVMIESLLPDVAAALQPYWTAFTATFPPDGGDFGGYLADREDEVAEALLAITDERRRQSRRATIVKAYNTVRGSAVKHVKAALPALGALVQKYAALPARIPSRPAAATVALAPVWLPAFRGCQGFARYARVVWLRCDAIRLRSGRALPAGQAHRSGGRRPGVAGDGLAA
jgi:hypothetical protein